MVYFVTGTDTDSGKSLISAALLSQALGQKCGFKPVASDCELTPDGLRNTDAKMLIEQSNMGLSYQAVNPICFQAAIAPHIAAKQLGTTLNAQLICDAVFNPAMIAADFALIEGAGGWRLPLGYGEYLSDTAKLLRDKLAQQHHHGDIAPALQVIIVVGMKLGCLNHALLTQEAVLADGFIIAGWVANQVDPNMAFMEENLLSLKHMMQSPFLGYVPFLTLASAEHAAPYLQQL